MQACSSACGEPGNDAECLACSCEAGCIARFDTCTGVHLNVCNGVYGRDALPDEPVLAGPWLLRAKHATGLLQTGPLEASTPSSSASFQFTTHLSTGFTHMVSFPLAGREYLLQHKSRCGIEPCIARISPVLGDGSLGRPAYLDTWTRGWDEIEFFYSGQELYLLRHKTGQAPAEPEGKGHLRIERVRLDPTASAITLTPVLDQAPTLARMPHWWSYDAFILGSETYLMRHEAERDGEVELLRAEISGDKLTLVPVSEGLNWSLGWDVVETFPVAERWYALLYKSGRMPVTQEVAGSVRVLGFQMIAGEVIGFTPALHDANWGSGVSRLTTYQSHESYLFVHAATTGAVSLQRINPTSSTWGSSFVSPIWSYTWSIDPMWDMVEILQQGKWETAP